MKNLLRFIAVLSLGIASTLLPLTGSGSTPNYVGLLDQDGLHLFKVNGRVDGIRSAIHVLSFNGPSYTLNIALAHGAIDGGLETPGALCESTPECVGAVNADFFDLTPNSELDPGDEVGGVIQKCVLLHTPEIPHQQANLDAHSVSNGLEWRSTLSLGGVTVAINAINQELPLSYANVVLPLVGNLLYTPTFALATPSSSGRVNLVFAQTDPTISPTTINTTTSLQLIDESSQSLRVAPGDVVVSLPLAAVPPATQVGEVATLTTTSSSGCDNIGGHPILLNQGAVVPIAHADRYMTTPYARTVLGWTASGATVIMTVDGKDKVAGATGSELDRVLVSLGVVTALDLDGGNSTTLYAQHHVINAPSRGAEHPVSTALLVVATPSS